MTPLADDGGKTALRRAAIRATLAPSVHNTQPWRLHLTAGRLDIYADRSRQLLVLDPAGRQLLISCGCAIMNASVSLAADGFGCSVTRARQPLHQELVASLIAESGSVPDLDLAALDPVIEVRQTNHRDFADERMPEPVVAALEKAAASEAASLFVVRDPEQQRLVATLSRHADDIENLNPAYRAELRAWTTDDDARRDGVPNIAVGRVDGSRHEGLPRRDFGVFGSAGLPAPASPSTDQTLIMLCTADDSPDDWMRAGEALERVWLEVTRHGYSASPVTQVTEVPSVRAELRRELSMVEYPHVLLRIGRAPVTPASRRRRLVDVLVDEG